MVRLLLFLSHLEFHTIAKPELVTSCYFTCVFTHLNFRPSVSSIENLLPKFNCTFYVLVALIWVSYGLGIRSRTFVKALGYELGIRPCLSCVDSLWKRQRGKWTTTLQSVTTTTSGCLSMLEDDPLRCIECLRRLSRRGRIYTEAWKMSGMRLGKEWGDGWCSEAHS